MTKTVFKRCNLTLDQKTIRECKELANERAQSVSALVRLLVAQAYEESTRKRAGS